MNAYLVALFLIDGSWMVSPRYLPLIQPSMDHCETLVERATDFVSNQVVDPQVKDISIACVEASDPASAVRSLLETLTETPTK